MSGTIIIRRKTWKTCVVSFDYYLKNIDNGWEQKPKVRLSVLNPGGKNIVNRVENEFPLARTKYTKLYLSAADSSLSTSLPQKETISSYQSESRQPKVTYRFRMTKSTEITGYMKLHLWVSAPTMTIWILPSK